MSSNFTEDGKIRFESDYGFADIGIVTFDSEDVRQALRSNPRKVGELAFKFLMQCCGELAEDANERSLYTKSAGEHIADILAIAGVKDTITH